MSKPNKTQQLPIFSSSPHTPSPDQQRKANANKLLKYSYKHSLARRSDNKMITSASVHEEEPFDDVLQSSL